MCTHTHTHARARARVGDALRRVQSQWIYAVSCKAKSTLPTGGAVAGGRAEGPRLAPPARGYVCVHIHL